jgi:hypothetical protein
MPANYIVRGHGPLLQGYRWLIGKSYNAHRQH